MRARCRRSARLRRTHGHRRRTRTSRAAITRNARDAERSIATDARDHVGCDFRRTAIFFLPSGSHEGNKSAL